MGYSQVVDKIRRSIGLVFTVEGQKITGKGSGFVFFKKGVLVTCNHVIKDRDANVLIQFPDKEEFIQAKVMIRDEEHDLALLKFNDDSREPLEVVSSEMIKEGMNVIFSGYPLGLTSLTTHQGILSAILTDATGITTYLIDGTVNSGNSGCPLMSEEGNVIGVVNAKRMEQSNLLNKMVEQKKRGAISLHGIDLVQLVQGIINNVQLGIGYAIPCNYIPQPHDIVKINEVKKDD